MLAVKSPIYLANFAVDMRKSIDGLTLLVVNYFKRNPTEEAMYVFCNRRRDKIKILYWERNGFALWYKRLEQDRFKIPRLKEEVYKLEAPELQWLLAGLDFSKVQGHKSRHYSEFF